MHGADTMTGIPIEWLFAAIAGLLGMVYADLKKELRSQTRRGINRDKKTERIRITLGLMCESLKLPYAKILDDPSDIDDTKS